MQNAVRQLHSGRLIRVNLEHHPANIGRRFGNEKGHQDVCAVPQRS